MGGQLAREGADVVVHYPHDQQGAERTRSAVEAAEAVGRRAAGRPAAFLAGADSGHVSGSTYTIDGQGA